MSSDVAVDGDALREEVRKKYREVAARPHGTYHFHTGRPLAARLGYDASIVDALPDAAVESFAGVANPLSLRPLRKGERVVDVGSGAGFDCFVAAHHVGPSGRVVGVDMTDEMLSKARATAASTRFDHVEFRKGLAENLPVDDGWADVVISNGVINLCADKQTVLREIYRALRPVVIWNSPISRTVGRYPRRLFKTSTSGPFESPVVCRVQPGGKCWRRSASSR